MSWPEGMNGCKVIPEWNTLISPGFCGSNARPKGSLLLDPVAACGPISGAIISYVRMLGTLVVDKKLFMYLV